MKSVSIFARFVLLGTVVFFAIGVFLATLIGPTLVNFTLKQQELHSVVFANRLAADFLLPEDFQKSALDDESRVRFEQFADHLQVPGLFRVKVWSSSGAIVYSDKKELIGKLFPPNAPFKNALQLKTTVTLVRFDPNDPRDAYEIDFGEGIKSYAPITFGASPRVVGVIEVASRAGFLKQQIGQTQAQFAIRIALSLLLMFLTLSYIVWRASRTVEIQRAKLGEYATNLEGLVLERTKKLEESTKRQLQQAEKLSQMKDEFVSLAAHQLRTPPSEIGWGTEVLLSGDFGKPNKKQREHLEGIYRANQRMIGIVDAFLDVSRIELGTLVLEPKEIPIARTVQEVLSELKPLILGKKAKIEEHYDEDAKTIYTDPKIIHILFENLLSNAVKYTPSGKGVIRISVKKQPPDMLLITVADNGYGIPKAEQSKIFTKLFRAENVREKEPTGTGLGLYLVKSVVEQSGGKIRFESEENKGTSFFVSLPLRNHGKRKT